MLKEVDAGALIKDIYRLHDISDTTYYNWKPKYGGLEASDLKRLTEAYGRGQYYLLAFFGKGFIQIIMNIGLSLHLNTFFGSDSKIRFPRGSNINKHI